MANKMKKEELLQSYLFILPAAIILLVFFLFPIGYAFVLSFLKLNSKFAVKAVVGAQNYTDVLSDRKLIAAFFNTLKYVAIVVSSPNLRTIYLNFGKTMPVVFF
jgi:ABC-type sugar transport system permease subunit